MSGGGALLRMGIALGTAGQVLTTDGTNVTFEDATGGGGAPHPLLDGTQNNDTVARTPADGDVIIGVGSTWDRLTAGAEESLFATASGGGLEWTKPTLLSSYHSDTLAAVVTKGSMIVGNTTPKWSELNVGTDGQVLTADSAAAQGLSWTTPSAASSPVFANVEKDLGTLPRYGGTFDIATTGQTANKPVMVWQDVGPYTGKGDSAGSIDEVEMDQVMVTGYVVDATTIRCYWTVSPRGGPLSGNVKFRYLVGG